MDFHNTRSCATRIQVPPATFTRSSVHLVGGLTTVRLPARRSEPGIVPSIVGFTKDSVAQESDRLAPGDRICSVNGISTARLTNDEVLRLLDNVEERASLEVEYYMPNYGEHLCYLS
ncbi:hypothetical protein ABMA27_015619 [Loxostege sticticalis]|uniref:PDZ domain-containing protein n=1 Tax=Loxostege sticticalis TaxID=481309 RepID=A0ABR3I8C0_LOXSC